MVFIRLGKFLASFLKGTITENLVLEGEFSSLKSFTLSNPKAKLPIISK